MNILSIYKHYWPDTTPYARLLKVLLESWAASGHNCTVFTAQPSYNNILHKRQKLSEKINGVNIVRTNLIKEKKNKQLRRLFHFLVYLIKSVFFVSRNSNRIDIVLVNCHPPILMGLTVRIIKRLFKIPYIYHCQDLHPESSNIAGKISNKLLYKLLYRIDTKNCEQASKIVTLSNDMYQSLLKRGIAGERVSIINNFKLLDSIIKGAYDIPEIFKEKKPEDYYILFAGNIGSFQGLENVISALKHIKNIENIKMIFLGEGSEKQKLINLGHDFLNNSLFFLPYQKIEVAYECMKKSDIGIVSLQPNVYKVAYPSKTMTYTDAGCPVLSIVEKDSFLFFEVESNKLGYGCWPNTPKHIAKVIDEAYTKRYKIDRKLISEISNTVYSIDNVLKKWEIVLSSLDN